MRGRRDQRNTSQRISSTTKMPTMMPGMTFSRRGQSRTLLGYFPAKSRRRDPETLSTGGNATGPPLGMHLRHHSSMGLATLEPGGDPGRLFLSGEVDVSNAQWSGGQDASTEDLRVALRRYRSFLERLLAA